MQETNWGGDKVGDSRMERSSAARSRLEEERAYQYWLHNLPGIGDKTIEMLLKVFGSARQIYGARTDALKQVVKEKKAEKIETFSRAWDVQRNYEELGKRKILFLPRDDELYPERLKKLENPPYAIYCLGSLPQEQAPSAAVIGARECSEYGSYMAQAFAGKMAEAGVAVISGMARGIDGIAQKAALQNGGRTYAVLGSGVDVCYPASNRGLYQEILETGGGILSPFPPGAPPLKQQFPERNRIVAGLSDLLLVVEARLKSGTWITVDMALEQGKSVYAVPGRLTDRLSDGCNFLIRQGAGIALTPEDILAELAVIQNRKGMKSRDEIKNRKEIRDQKVTKDRVETSIIKDGELEKSDQRAEKTEMELLSFLDAYPRSADEILEAMKKKGRIAELPQLLEELIGLCMENKAKQVCGSYFVKNCDR